MKSVTNPAGGVRTVAELANDELDSGGREESCRPDDILCGAWVSLRC